MCGVQLYPELSIFDSDFASVTIISWHYFTIVVCVESSR